MNPVTDIYVLPANSPDKKSSHKVRYTVLIERCRKIPGFLGIASGLIVKRPKNVESPKEGYDFVDTHGMTLPGDTIMGAWAEFYCQGLIKPIRHEVSFQQAKGKGPLWNTRESFMLIKVATDELLRLKVSPMFAGDTDLSDETEGDAVMLEAQTPEVMPSGNAPQSGQEKTEPVSPFTAGTEYVGEILRVRLPEGRKPGAIEFNVGDRRVVCFFWKTPAMLEGVDLVKILGTFAAFSFTDKPGTDGKPYRELATFVPEARADDFDGHDGRENEPKEAAAREKTEQE